MSQDVLSIPKKDAAKPSKSAREIESPFRILIVDDEPNIVKALTRVFRRDGYDIHTATNGREALEILSKGEFHLILSDFRMPEMDGGELMKCVNARYPETVRIILTGHADTSSVMDAINEGAVYKFIVKPWNDDDLRVTVSLALKQFALEQQNRTLQRLNDRAVKEIDALSRLAVTNRTQIAALLEKHGLLSAGQIDELKKLQLKLKDSTIRLLLRKQWVTEKDVHNVLTEHTKFKTIDVADAQVDATVAGLVPRSFCVRHLILPIKQEGQRLVLAMADPLDLGLTDDLRFCVGLDVLPKIAGATAIEAKIAEVYGSDEKALHDVADVFVDDDLSDKVKIIIDERDDNFDLEELLRGTEEAPAIRLVNGIILEAIRMRASDIHIQPQSGSSIVRYRVDGVMADRFHIPTKLALPVVSRIKIMAELDIAERRKPQDGRVTVSTPMRVVDLRISSLPTISGEKIVMRVLDRQGVIQKIADLGFADDDRLKVLRVIQRPQGIVLATGPTGGGKTTTLYSLLQHGATPIKSYVTIEDPVEYNLDMAGQVLVRESIGFGFATALRAILRQDPDVILLGEIRDLETAEAAFHAAMTGHLVFSTLHTNSAAATIDRLVDLGVNRQVIASALEAVIAQRLVRKVCEHCCEEVVLDPRELSVLGPDFAGHVETEMRGKGCAHCNQVGYKGRIGLYEMLISNDAVRSIVSSGGSAVDLQKHMQAEGTPSLLLDARRKVEAGATTVEEVIRVLGPQQAVDVVS